MPAEYSPVLRCLFAALIAAVIFGCANSSDQAGRSAARELPLWRAADLNPVREQEAPKHEAINFSNRATQPPVIVKPLRSTRDSDTAMSVLRSLMERAGVKAEVVATIPAEGVAAIVLGDRPEAQTLGLDGSKLPPEGFAIKTAPNRVFIVGNSAGAPAHSANPSLAHDGLAWGIYEFAERFVGARFYFPGQAGTIVRARDGFVVPPTFIEDAPVFAVREIWPSWSDSSRGQGTNLSPLHHALRSGGWWPHAPAIHQPDWSKSEYVKTRPEIFQLSSTGARDPDIFCYSNPRTLATFLEELDASFNRTPGKFAGASFVRGNTITVSPHDAELACYCPDCRKLWVNGQYGGGSLVMATFTKKLSEAVQARWPDKTVLFVPYLNYTTAPKGATFSGNVQVEVCGMPGLAMYKEPSIAASEQANIDAWVAATGRPLLNWHYSCWPEDRTAAAYLFPHVIQKFYRDNRSKTAGTFINGVTDHWPRQSLSLYVWMKCLWNPEFNVDAAIDAYCRDLFGPASTTMQEIVQLQINGWEKSRWPGGAMTASNLYSISFPPPMIEKMTALLAKARSQAKGDPLVEQRLAYYAPALEAMFKQAAEVAKGTDKHVDVQKVGEDPTVDGKLDDAVWARAQAVPFVMAWDKKQADPKYPTTVKAVWTDRGMTVGFRMTEPAPATLSKDRKGRDHSTLWWDDNVEMILDVTGKGQGDFYHFLISAGGQIMDAHKTDTTFTADQVKFAISIGTDHWSMEVFVPWTQFPNAAKPGSGTRTQWVGNFTRHRVADCGIDDKPTAPGSTREYQRVHTRFAGPSVNLSDLVPIRFVE